MDVETVSWVGDMYKKFEAMCVEVEENVYQDTVEFVESQAKTVGACVKRFCSDVMQDLLPLSSDDLVKRESPASHIVNHAGDVIHDMSEAKTKKERIEARTEKLGKDKSNEKLLRSEVLPPKTIIQDGAYETVEEKTCVEINGGSERVAITSVTSRSSYPTAVDELWNDEDMPKELAGRCTSEETTIQDEMRGDYANKQAVDGKMKLEESCVLVDKCEAFPQHPEGKQRSYKKKIKDALHPRSWSNRGNERLILEHEIVEARLDSKGHAYVGADDERGNESSLESGWEIV